MYQLSACTYIKILLIASFRDQALPVTNDSAMPAFSIARHTSGPLGAILEIQIAGQELHERISLPKFRNCDVEFIDSNFLNKCYIYCFLVAGHCIISRYLVPGSSQRAIIVRGSLSMPCKSNIEQSVEAGAFNHISRLQNHLSDIIQALYRACQALCHLTISESHRPTYSILSAQIVGASRSEQVSWGSLRS